MPQTLLAIALKTLVSLLPVLVFLVGLQVMDSYKLIKPRTLLLTILGGAAAAAAGYLLNTGLIPLAGGDFKVYSRYVAPLFEEVLKASVLLGLFLAQRIGFLVDASILGFAVGAGFSLFENIYYLNTTPDASLTVWIIRGFGTATMHGGTTAVFGAVTKMLSDRKSRSPAAMAGPGLLAAYALHSAFNHFLLPPMVATAVILAVFPVVAINIFLIGERSTRKWLDVGFDSDVELLGLIDSGRIGTTKIGRYLASLKGKFPGEVVADMLCMLRLHLELSISAKGLMLMKEEGFPVKPEPGVREKFEELKYLQKSIGQTGMRTISPIVHRSRQDLWEMHLLGMK